MNALENRLTVILRDHGYRWTGDTLIEKAIRGWTSETVVGRFPRGILSACEHLMPRLADPEFTAAIQRACSK